MELANLYLDTNVLLLWFFSRLPITTSSKKDKNVIFKERSKLESEALLVPIHGNFTTSVSEPQNQKASKNWKKFWYKRGFRDVKGKTAWGTVEVMLTWAVDCATKGEFNRLRIESRIVNTTCWLRKLERKAKWNILGNALLLLADKVNDGPFFYHLWSQCKRKKKKKSGIIGKIDNHLAQKENIMKSLKLSCFLLFYLHLFLKLFEFWVLHLWEINIMVEDVNYGWFDKQA